MAPPCAPPRLLERREDPAPSAPPWSRRPVGRLRRRPDGYNRAMNVEIWSDIVCPWCYIGKRRFEGALADFEHRDDVSVTWRSLQLDPGAPPRPLPEGYGAALRAA